MKEEKNRVMRKKMGRYMVDFTKVTRKPYLRKDGLYQTEAVIAGDIEIGIEIDPYTWTGDWLGEATFGKSDCKNYRLINVENNLTDYGDRNEVVAVWEKR